LIREKRGVIIFDFFIRCGRSVVRFTARFSLIQLGIVIVISEAIFWVPIKIFFGTFTMVRTVVLIASPTVISPMIMPTNNEVISDVRFDDDEEVLRRAIAPFL
jgi:hypothetical protein